MTRSNDPPRLVDVADSPRPLVDALARAAADLPSTDQLQEIATGLGPELLGGAAQGGPRSGEQRRRSLGPRVARRAAVFKLLLAAVVGAAGTGSLVWRAHSRRDEPPKSGAVVQPRSAPPDTSAAVRPEPEREPSAPALELPAPKPPRDPAPLRAESTRSTGNESPEPATSSRLPTGAAAFPDTEDTSEVAILNRAQRIVARDPAGALSLAEDHARRFPSGALAQEREFIAIEALLGLGRRAEASARAAQFRAAFPGSAHARRLDLLLGDAPGNASP
jgi:hypothetical protein